MQRMKGICQKAKERQREGGLGVVVKSFSSAKQSIFVGTFLLLCAAGGVVNASVASSSPFLGQFARFKALKNGT